MRLFNKHDSVVEPIGPEPLQYGYLRQKYGSPIDIYDAYFHKRMTPFERAEFEEKFMVKEWALVYMISRWVDKLDNV